MKALGKKSISSLFEKVITITWYLEFLLLLTPPLVFLDNDGINYSWPITVTADNLAPTATSASNRISDFQFNGRLNTENTSSLQTLSFEDSSLGRRWLQTLHNLVYIALILFVTWHLKKIFAGFTKNQPFKGNNAKRIRWIAFSILFLVCFNVLESFFHRLYTSSTVKLIGATFDPYRIQLDYRTFILGLLLLIVSETFRRGHEYQVDSESIL